jgi:hypothetical protein
MNKLTIAFAAAFVVFSSLAYAEDAAPSYPAWNDVLRTCSAEYKERSDAKTNKGATVWQEFLADCKTRKGFVPKKDQNKKDFVRVPDKQ